MGVERVRLGLADSEEQKDLGSNVKVKVRRKEGAVTDRSINGTAYHEACHSLAALLVGVKLIRATDVPGPGYGGYTAVSHYNAVVTAAAEAMGCDGTGHDMMTVREMGDSPTAAVAAAYALLAHRDKEIRAIATTIQKRRVATGSEMRASKERVNDDQVEVTVESTTERRTVSARLINNVLDIPIDRT